MRKQVFIYAITVFIVTMDIANAFSPSTYSPLDGSYLTARSPMTFMARAVLPNINSTRTILYIRASDATYWDSYNMTCVNLPEFNPDLWECNKTVAFNTAGSDTTEYFYFTFYNTTGSKFDYHSSTSPVKLIIDRLPPQMEFTVPENNSYIKQNKLAILNVYDSASGITASPIPIYYSWDNSSWVRFTGGEAPDFTVSLDSSTLQENLTAKLYVTSRDVVGNYGYNWINIIPDRTAPILEVVHPSGGEEINGVYYLEIRVSDTYSGINTGSANYTIGGYEDNMDCTYSSGYYVCEEYVNTGAFEDGNYGIVFVISDIAGNYKFSGVNVDIDNTEMFIYISNPDDNSYVGGTLIVTASVTNPNEKLTSVKLDVKDDENNMQTYSMTCDGSYNCNKQIDTTALTEGKSYTLIAKVLNTENVGINHSVRVSIDNTDPQITIDSPVDNVVNGTIYPKVVIIDENGVDRNSVRFNISTYSYSMLCTEYVQGKKYTCTGNFDTTKLTDDYYDLIFYGKDIAGNWNAEKKYLLVDNDELSGPDPADFVTTTTTTVYPTATTTTLQNSGDNTDDTNGNTGNQNTGNTQTATQVIERITTPVLVLFGNIQKGFGEIDSWTLKAFGISMVVFLFIIAVVKIVGSRKSLEPQDHELETYR